jgi:hypothetical protein
MSSIIVSPQHSGFLIVRTISGPQSATYSLSRFFYDEIKKEKDISYHTKITLRRTSS